MQLILFSYRHSTSSFIHIDSMAQQPLNSTYDGPQLYSRYRFIPDETSSDSLPMPSPNETAKSQFIDYGPIRIRVSKRPTLTLANGRRSKNMNLEGEEAAKREQRREKNRVSARRLKEKRQTIEEELSDEIKHLEDEQVQLESYLSQLQYQKQQLESELGIRMYDDPLDELLNANENTNAVLFHKFAESFHLLESLKSDRLDINELLAD